MCTVLPASLAPTADKPLPAPAPTPAALSPPAGVCVQGRWKIKNGGETCCQTLPKFDATKCPYLAYPTGSSNAGAIGTAEVFPMGKLPSVNTEGCTALATMAGYTVSPTEVNGPHFWLAATDR